MSNRVAGEWHQAGVQHFMLRFGYPFDTKALVRLLKLRDSAVR